MAKWNVPDTLLSGFTQCAHCDALVHQEEALVKVFHTGRSTEQEVFCGESCHQEYYLKRLNRAGL